MKISILTIAFATSIFTGAFAQKINADKLPVAVKIAFAKEYAEVKGVKWDRENSDFEASFKFKGEDLSVLFNAKGMIIETEKGIKVKQLPASVQTAMEGKKIKEAAIITKNGKNYYEAESAGKDYLFDDKGMKVEKY